MDDDEGMGLAMTADNTDGIDEDLTRAVGMAMIAASRAGEQLTRMKQAADRKRQARAAGATEQARRELAAHTEAARAYFDVVTSPEYLTGATDEQIREVTRRARAWTQRLPEAQRAEHAATTELDTRNPGAGRGNERAVTLAAGADTADRHAAEPGSGPQRQPIDASDGTAHQPGHDNPNWAGEQAASTAASAQTRPAREASTVMRKDTVAAHQAHPSTGRPAPSAPRTRTVERSAT